jgi:hypothetical protein
MFLYIIIRELLRVLSHLDVTAQKGITELSTMDGVEIKISEFSFHQIIPKPRDKGSILLNSLDSVTLQPLLGKKIKIATKRKFSIRKK